jgi:hypothetical protein
MPGTLHRCYFCHREHGHCQCVWSDVDGFDFEDFTITAPNVSECGRFFVDPVVYYGEAFTRWYSESKRTERK